jgi:hypothetical protein
VVGGRGVNGGVERVGKDEDMVERCPRYVTRNKIKGSNAER